jgi:SAM-dependent methyltransferase
LIFVHPTPNNIEFIYNYTLGHEQQNSVKIIKYPEVKNTLNICLARFLISKFQVSKVLDIGCGAGNFILGIRDLGVEVLGIEPNKHAAAYCAQLGLRVQNDFFPATNLIQFRFDLINIADVIEHVADPRALIKSSMEILSNGGILLIRTPNLNSLWSKQTFLLAKWFGIPWSSLTPPEHLSNFTLHGLLNLLKEEHLSIESVFDEPPSLLYELGQLHLRRDFLRNPSFSNLLRLLIGYSTYTLIYILNQILKPFLHYNFSQTIVAKKLI